MKKGAMQRQSKAAGFRALMAAVINRAIDDLRSTGPKLGAVEKDRAMAFILREDCEAWCLELGIDYEAVKEKAAALYRRFLEKADGGRKAPRSPGRVPNYGKGPPDVAAVATARSTGILEKAPDPGFPPFSARRLSVPGRG
jgi:hypothetical protein